MQIFLNFFEKPIAFLKKMCYNTKYDSHMRDFLHVGYRINSKNI
jgi:hypothetical protein